VVSRRPAPRGPGALLPPNRFYTNLCTRPGMFDMCVNGCGYEPTIIKCTENIPHYPWGFVECGEEIP